MDIVKNPAAVALGKLAASRRTREELAEAGRQGGLAKAKNRRSSSKLFRDGADQRNHERNVRLQETRLTKRQQTT
jgi:hypothetical protein